MSRHETVRRLLVEGPCAVSDRFGPRYEPAEDGSTLGLAIKREALFDALDVVVDELFDVPGDRVLARCTISARKGVQVATWPAVVIVAFDGNAIVGSWAVQDELPWLQALGVLPGDDEIERRLHAAAA